MPRSQQTFKRSVDALESIFSFTDSFLSAQSIEDSHRFAVNFAIEELFTNMIKYSTETTSDIQIALEHLDGKLEIRLTDFDVEPFDVTEAPDADVELPLEQRIPGGLGLHLIRRLMDEIDYHYGNRRSTITLIKYLEAEG